jgi:hypothetical protein
LDASEALAATLHEEGRIEEEEEAFVGLYLRLLGALKRVEQVRDAVRVINRDAKIKNSQNAIIEIEAKTLHGALQTSRKGGFIVPRIEMRTVDTPR